MSSTNLIEIAKILTNNDQKFVNDISEMTNDFYAFYKKHEEWFNEELGVYKDKDDVDNFADEQILANWLHLEFSSVIDWKEYIDEVLLQLEGIGKNLGYTLDIDKIEIDTEEDTFEALKMINAHFSARGYKLISLQSCEDAYYLFIAPDKEYDRLLKLGSEIGFEFWTFPPYEFTLKPGVHHTFAGIDWRVLDVQNGKALLLSEKVIEERKYNERETGVTWETCTLRRYLNEEFYNGFGADEKARIAETTIINNDNPWSGIKGGAATNDKIFLLSIEEVVKYFGDSGQLKNRPSNKTWSINDQYNCARIAMDSGQLKKRFLNDPTGNLGEYHSARIAADGESYPSWWWLRSPGYFDDSAVFVRSRGTVELVGCNVAHDNPGVRPALWLNL